MYKMKQLFSILSLFIIYSHSALLSASDEKVHYQIDIKNPSQHLAQVTILLPKASADHVDVIMPAWRPGRYQILPLANGVQKFMAKGAKGNRLNFNKIDRNTWRIQLHNATKVAISYELYANELADRTRHIDSTHAYLDAVASLMYSPKFKQLPVTLDVNVPRGWDTVSGLKSASGRDSYVAKNYDELADSPIETGFHEKYLFKTAGADFTVIIWGKGNYKGKKIAKDLAKLVKVQKKYWGDFPFKKYVFIIHATSGARGATEHLNSTVIQKPRWKFESKSDYLDFLSTASHEFAHSWNVKSYRPAGIDPYDYTKENYSSLLWFAEGGTSYLQNQFLVQAGLMTQKEFLKRLAKDLGRYLRRPGRFEMSAAESSFDEWIALSGGRAVNDGVNIYSKGEMLSLWMDLMLISHSSGEISIQAIHKKLFEQFPATIKGYSERDMIQLLTESGLKDADKLWQSYVRGTTELPLINALKQLGLSFHYVESDRKGKKIKELKSKPFSGIKLKDHSTVIMLVLKNSPAWKAELTSNDQLVAVNGLRVTHKNFHTILRTMEIDKKISISYFRNDELKQTSIKLSQIPKGKATLSINKDINEAQKKFFQKWLGKAVEIVKDEKMSTTNR